MIICDKQEAAAFAICDKQRLLQGDDRVVYTRMTTA